MSRRTIHRIQTETVLTRVVVDTDAGEYQVITTYQGRHLGTYHTDNKADALGTAEAEHASAVKQYVTK